MKILEPSNSKNGVGVTELTEMLLVESNRDDELLSLRAISQFERIGSSCASRWKALASSTDVLQAMTTAAAKNDSHLRIGRTGGLNVCKGDNHQASNRWAHLWERAGLTVV